MDDLENKEVITKVKLVPQPQAQPKGTIEQGRLSPLFTAGPKHIPIVRSLAEGPIFYYIDF